MKKKILSHLGGKVSQDRILTVVKESDYITNVWNNFTEDGGVEHAHLNNFGNGWIL